MPFGLWTRLDQKKHTYNPIRQVAPMCPHGRLLWPLVNFCDVKIGRFWWRMKSRAKVDRLGWAHGFVLISNRVKLCRVKKTEPCSTLFAVSQSLTESEKCYVTDILRRRLRPQNGCNRSRWVTNDVTSLRADSIFPPLFACTRVTCSL